MKISKFLKNVPENNILPSQFAYVGKIVFCLRFSLFSFVRLSPRIINYHHLNQKMVLNFARRLLVVSEAALANYYLPLTPCKGLDLRYSVIFGRIIDEKIL